MPRQPHIVLTICDDQRFDALGAAGNPHIQTPHLDALAQRGTRMRRAYHMGGLHGAICAPSRAMLHTGRHLFDAPLSMAGQPADEPRWEDPPVHPTLLGEALQQAGYFCFGTGKWHNQKHSFAATFNHGAKIFFGGMSDHDQVPVYEFDPSGEYPEAKKYTGDKHSTDLFADAAIEFIRQYDSDQPLFLYVAFTAPHDPRTPPPEYAAMYPPDQIPVPENFLPEHPFDNGELRIRDENLLPFPRTPEAIQKEIADYYAMTTHMDAAVGRIHAALAEKGMLDDTIAIHTADHGLSVGQHGLLGKQNMYEHSTRVPMIVAGPGVPAGAERDGLCYMHDLCPTLLELAQAAIPATCQSQSLLPLIEGRCQAFRQSVFCAYRDRQRMVREGDHKLIEYFVNGTRQTQLFDLAADPAELHDLAQRPECGPRLDALREALARWQYTLHDPLARTPTQLRS